MPGWAKFLAFLNCLVAAAFLCLAALDWQKRSDWSYEYFRRQLLVHGIPINESDAGWRVDRPIHQDLSAATIRDMFKSAGGNPVYTQVAELQRARQDLQKEVDGLANDDARRQRLRQVILDQASTLDERLAEAKRLPADLDGLWKRVDQLFDAAASYANEANEKQFDAARARQAIAHLLYNLSADPNHHQRVLVVVGLKQFNHAAETQADNLREMANRLRAMMVDDRTLFEAEFGRQVQRILGLAEAIEQLNVDLAYKKDLRERSEVELKNRQADRERLTAEVGKTKGQRDAALDRQQALEAELFKINAELGVIKEYTENLERELRALERAGGR